MKVFSNYYQPVKGKEREDITFKEIFVDFPQLMIYLDILIQEA